MDFSIGESIRFGWDKTRQHFLFLLGVIGIYVAVVVALGILGRVVPPLVANGLNLLVVSPLLTLGVLRVFLDLVGGAKPDFSRLFSTGNLLPTYWLTILVMVPVVLAAGGLFMVAGFVLGITTALQIKALFQANLFVFLALGLGLMAATVYFGLRFTFVHWVLADEGCGAIECYRESLRATRRQAGHLFFFILALVGLNLLGFLCLGIGLVVTAMISSLATAHVYSQIRPKA